MPDLIRMKDMTDIAKTTDGCSGLVTLLRATALRVTMIAALMICGLSFWSSPVTAQSLDAARAAGMVGERFDGYAVARASATPAARALVDSVNAQRRQIYAKRASEQNISPDAVGKLYAAQIVSQVPSGTWILQSSGAWTRK